MSIYCPQCGAPVDAGKEKCEYCGAVIPSAQPKQPEPVQQAQPQQVVYVQQQQPVDPSRNNWPIKNKIVAGILAILLGGIGIHKFYLGKVGAGILFLLFCWTGIPALIGLIEGVIILCSNDENFQIKYKCRIG